MPYEQAFADYKNIVPEMTQHTGVGDHELARAIVALSRQKPVAIDDAGIFDITVGCFKVNAQRVRITGGPAWAVWYHDGPTKVMCTTPHQTIAQMCLMIRSLANSNEMSDEQQYHARRVKMDYLYPLSYQDTPIGEVMPFFYPNNRTTSKMIEERMALLISSPPLILPNR